MHPCSHWGISPQHATKGHLGRFCPERETDYKSLGGWQSDLKFEKNDSNGCDHIMMKSWCPSCEEITICQNILRNQMDCVLRTWKLCLLIFKWKSSKVNLQGTVCCSQGRRGFCSLHSRTSEKVWFHKFLSGCWELTSNYWQILDMEVGGSSHGSDDRVIQWCCRRHLPRSQDFVTYIQHRIKFCWFILHLFILKERW